MKTLFIIAAAAALIVTPALAAKKKVVAPVVQSHVTWESMDFSRPGYRTDPDPRIRAYLNRCGPTVPSCAGGDDAGGGGN